MGAGASNLDQGHPVLCGCTTCRAAAGPESAPTAAAAGSSTPSPAAMSGTFYIDALLPPDQYRWNHNAPGTPLTITYGFMTTMPWYSSNFGYESGPFQAFTAAQQEGVHRAIALFEQIANVDFVFRADGDNAQIRFGSATLGEFEAAHTYYPEPSGDWAGDVWFNITDPDVYNQSAGSYGFMVTLHEIGHALGLKHSFNDGSTFSPVLPADKDNRQYTVMSYNDPASTPSLEPASPMLYDIAALQYLYGANTAYKSGNDTWRWNPNETFLWAIWDGGGNDTLDASNQTRRVILDLNPGSFSSLGSYNGGDALNNLAIAYNAWIENANGGSGNDTITGNQLNNRIDGGGGNDTITGGDGNDTLLGGAGDDTFYADFGADSFDGGSGFDTVIYGSGIASGIAVNFANPSAGSSQGLGDTFVGVEKIVGTSYSDSFAGDGNANWFVGGYGDDTFYGSGGADIFDGGEYWDTLSYAGSSAGVSVNLMTGVLSGGDADGDKIASSIPERPDLYLNSIENLIGSDFADVLVSGVNVGSIRGGAGNDTLYQGAGSSGVATFYGGTGNDIYYLVPTLWAASPIALENTGEGYDEIRSTADVFLNNSEIEKVVYLGSGDFHFSGNIYTQTVTGGSGNDVLIGGGGADVLIAGDGNDIIYFAPGTAVINGGEGTDTVQLVDTYFDLQNAGCSFIDVERFVGTQNIDEMLGDAADNTFIGGYGDDTLDGRGGSDTVIYKGTAADYAITNQGGGVVTVAPKRSALQILEGYDTLKSIENIVFTGEVVNQAPFVSRINNPVGRNTSNPAFAFFSAQDSADYFLYYEVRDTTHGAGYLTLDGVQLAVGQSTPTITKDDHYWRLQYHAGALGEVDQIEVRASDGVAWSAWTTISITPVNYAPNIILNRWMNSGQLLPHGTTVIAGTDLVSVQDSDGDPIVALRMWDESAGNGYFRFNGVAQATNQVLEIAPGQLSSVEYVVGTSPYTADVLRFQAYDGISWTGIAYGSLYGPSNAVPIVSASNLSPSHAAGFIAASSMFSVSDGDGDAITQYEFRDNTAGHGYFRLNGVQQAASFQIAANQLAQLQFVPTATVGGLDQIEVRAFDGLGWGSWKSFTVGAVPNATPTVTPTGAALARASSVAASNLISVADGDGDAIARYRFFDGTTGNGRFLLSGAAQAENVNIEITSAQLPNLHFAFGAPGTVDTVWAQVFDGFVWSTWTSFSVTAPQNSAPVTSINTASLNPAKGTATIAASSFFSAVDNDGDAITQYKFFDGTTGNGRFERNGTPEVELANITVNASDLANFRFRVGGGSDVLWVQAYDGAVWGAWKSFTVAAPANVAPTVNVVPLNPLKSTAFIAGSALFTVTDPDDASMAKYRFFDGNTGNGRFQLNGADQAELANIEINASDLANFRYRTSTTGAGDLLWVQAFDGAAWSTWQSFMVTAPVNVAPTVNVQTLNPAKSTAFIAGSALFTVTDPDDTSMAKYRFFDSNTGNGRFQLNGADQAEAANIEINASDLANFRYRTSTTGAGDLLWVQAFDGFAWGAWKSFMVNAPVNVAPTVNVQTLNPSKGTSFISAANLFTVTDPDDATVARLRFFDGNAGNGRFQLNGIDQVELSNIEIAAADLANLRFRLGGGSDLLWVQAYDGFAWSTWKSFTVNAPVNAAPTVFVEDLVYGDNAVLDASTLFVVNDPDDTTMVSYRFWDSEANSGYFRLNGVALQQQRNVEIGAADLANLDYIGVGYSRDTIWVQAFDGTAWSQWKTFDARAANYGAGSISGFEVQIISPFPNEPPAVTVTNTNAQRGSVVSLGSLVSATDPEGDTITKWRFYDTTAGRGTLRLNGVAQADGSQIEVMASQLAAAEFLAGTTAGFNKITASAFDGTNWSDPKLFIINTLVPV